MNVNYPYDADGDALRRVAASGADTSRPMEIDFVVEVPDREAGEAVARRAECTGYRTEVIYDEEGDAWDCFCRKTMVPTHDGVVAAQLELDEISRPFGGRSDGWGTTGDSADT
jgi:hypothetical protein